MDRLEQRERARLRARGVRVVKLAAQDRYLARSRTYEPGSYFSHGGQRSHEPLLLTSAVARVRRAGCPVIVSSLYLWCPWQDSNLQPAA